MKKTHEGSCHCGAIRFEADVDLHTATKCNCRVCTKLALFSTKTEPGLFRLTAGEDSLSFWKTQIGKLYFCKTCGAHPFADGDLSAFGHGGPYISVNVHCLDDVDPSEITPAYWDGRHDNWQVGTSSKPWPYEPKQAAM